MKTTAIVFFTTTLAACGGAETTRCHDRAATTTGAEVDDDTVPDETVAEAPPPTTSAAEVRGAADAPVRVAPNGQARVTILAQGGNAFVARLEMEPEAAVPEHQDATEEYIHVLEGGGTMVIDGVEHEVVAGATVFMPANATVSFQNGPTRMVALQVFAGPAPAAKYDRWTAAE
jgi:quercetin dioxygenase-like cupin family protein